MTLQDLKRAERYAFVVRDTTKAMYEAAQKAVDDLEEAIRKAEREEEAKEPAGLPWDKAPAWANWAAMDRGGSWLWYENEPSQFPTYWMAHTGRGLAFKHVAVMKWDESKQRRPQ